MADRVQSYFINPDMVNYIDLMPGVKSRILTGLNGGKMMMALTTVEPGAAVPTHAHPHEQIVNILEGEVKYSVGSEAQNLGEDSVLVIPPNVPHGGEAIVHCRLLDVFYPVREDYR